MDIYTVEQITEADFGCEETERKEPMALLKLKSGAEEKYVELSESELEKKGISEGKKVIFTASGEILKYIRVVAAVVREHEVQAGIQNGDLDGRRTDIDSKCIIF